jgi:hypothetical protein
VSSFLKKNGKLSERFKGLSNHRFKPKENKKEMKNNKRLTHTHYI